MKFLFISLLALSLGACATAPAPVTITKIQTQVVATPAELLKPCPVTPPQSKDAFMSADMLGRQTLLADYTTSLLKDLGLCNTQIKEIKIFQDKQIQLYKTDAKEKP